MSDGDGRAGEGSFLTFLPLIPSIQVFLKKTRNQASAAVPKGKERGRDESRLWRRKWERDGERQVGITIACPSLIKMFYGRDRTRRLSSVAAYALRWHCSAQVDTQRVRGAAVSQSAPSPLSLHSLCQSALCSSPPPLSLSGQQPASHAETFRVHTPCIASASL